MDDPLTSSEERLLAERAAAGDNAAVEKLYDAYEQRLYGYCHRICRHPEDAADATQEAFCNVIQRLPGLDTANLNFAAYLFTAARNASMDLIKQRRRAEPTDEVPEDPFAVGDLDTDPERALLTGDQQRAAREANDRLPETQRTALALREVSELSYDEIALTMDMNSNAVAQLISRARLNFYKQLRAGAVVVAPTDAAGERALELTAAQIDGKITDEDLAWLQSHLNQNESSRINAEAMQESAKLYRAIGPVVVIAALKGATMAKAANLSSGVGGDGPGEDGPSDGGSDGASGGAGETVVSNPNEYDSDDQKTSHAGKRRGALVAIIAILALFIAVAIAGGTGSGEQSVAEQTAEVAGPTSAVAPVNGEDTPRSKTTKKQSQSKQSAPATTQPQVSNQSPNSNGGAKKEKSDDVKSKPDDSSGDEPVETPPAETPPPETTPPADPPVTTPPPKPPKPPGGPGSICGTPGCVSPPPPVP